MRIAGVTIPDDKRLEIALTSVYGVGRPLAKGTLATATIGAGKTRSGEIRVNLGDAAALGPGTWTMTLYFVTADTAWESPPASFRQPF
jgi:hypothetical protein